LGLVCAQLSIIDPSDGGAQPIANRAGQLIIVYNDEIYNYRALRDALIADGVAFASGSDTEVLLALYAKHGPSNVGGGGG